MLNYAVVPIRTRPLGQASSISIPTAFRVIVVDKQRGNPFENAQVILHDSSGAQSFAYTDASGAATFRNVPDGQVTADVVLPSGLKISQAGNARSDMFVEVAVCAPVPLLSKTEMVVLAGGAALAAAGFIWKVNAFEVLGELAVGGGIFSAIYRNSCGW